MARIMAERRQAVIEEFNATLEDARRFEWDDQLNCRQFDQGAWIDYTTPPSDEVAAWMCKGCPLLQLCSDYARATKPGWGVWGGTTWGTKHTVN